jgi:hypothetical protein
MQSLIIKICCILFALFCIGWYVKTYEPELYAQFNALLINGAGGAPAVSEQVQPEVREAVQPRAPVRADTPPPLTWIFTEALPDESLSMLRTQVALRVGCFQGETQCNERTIEAGTFAGLCSIIEQPESSDELTGVLCWFAGAGDEIGVFEENEILVLKKGELGEPTAETAGFRGNFTTITQL